jgi:hypothetical protein
MLYIALLHVSTIYIILREFHILYAKVTNRWTGHVARFGRKEVLVRKPEGKNSLEEIDANGRIILK